MSNDDTVAEAKDRGFEDGLYGQDLLANPYARGTKEFDAWRTGWAAGDNANWRTVLLDKHKKASAE